MPRKHGGFVAALDNISPLCGRVARNLVSDNKAYVSENRKYRNEQQQQQHNNGKAIESASYQFERVQKMNLE